MNILFTNISNKIRLFAYVYYVGFLVTYESTNNGDPRILRIMHLQVSFTSCDLTGYPNTEQRWDKSKYGTLYLYYSEYYIVDVQYFCIKVSGLCL